MSQGSEENLCLACVWLELASSISLMPETVKGNLCEHKLLPQKSPSQLLSSSTGNLQGRLARSCSCS